MKNDPEFDLQADNGSGVGPLGLAVGLLCVITGIVLSWNWAKILGWLSVITLIGCGIGFAILATR